MLGDFLVAMALAVGVTLFLAGLVRLVPPGWRRLRDWRRWVLFTFLLGLSFLLVTGAWGRGFAAGVAGAGVVILAPIVALRARRAWKFERALAGLRSEATRAASVRELDRLLGPSPAPGSRGYREWVTLSQFVGAGAARAGCSDAALVWLDRVDGTWLDRAAAAAHAQVTAVCCISLGQRARARQVIARVTRPAPSPLWERALVAIEVLLDALEGDAERAEVRAREGLAQETEATVRATWQTAHAHALAALGHRDDALAALRAVRDAFPSDPMLARIARHGGPASALAESLLTEARTPYR